MIVMAVADMPERERKMIVASARSRAAYYTDDYWKYLESGSSEGMKKIAEETDRLDLACVDLTLKGSLPTAEAVRREHDGSYIILIADESISPVKYIRPSIQAESLMMKPLDKHQIDRAMNEAVGNCIKRLEIPDKEKYFVAETRGNKEMINYDRIIYFEAREKKVYLVTEREEYGFYDTIEGLMEQLDDTFIRCHRSFVVNSKRIRSIQLSAGLVYMDDGTELPLSRSYKPDLKQFMKSMKDNNSKGY